MNNKLSKEARAGFRLITATLVAIPTFWWSFWLGAQLTDGFRWWMIPTAVTQIVLALFARFAARSALNLMENGDK